ncbi:hypothetical protein [Pontiella desulfatans]|uniref:hypothetical protein n=1 Tax=Pontiella desulfatans TaxID=2750659 RepID=UPI001444478B|nr:hypothetical protein [Pontiella desulfatans]
MLLPVHAWVWLAAENPVLSVLNGAVPTFILSGRMCTERFSIIHAGSALDQPTIGKWLFWFTVMAATALPCTAGVGWLANRTSKAGRIAFSVNTFVLGFMLLSILSWPVLWLIQYICSMGFTPRRIQGLLYSISAAAGIILFLIWATRKPQSRQPRSQP